MKQGLQLRIGQQLTMTPQLQQAIKLLQLSSLDLQQEIQQALYSNPLLEMVDEVEHQEEQQRDKEEQKGRNGEDTETGTLESGSLHEEWNKDIPEQLAVDANWDDIYPSTNSSSTAVGPESRDFDTFHTVTESLHDHLLWQLNLATLSETDRLIAATIIDNLDDNGFMESSAEELWQTMDQDAIDFDEVIAVLHCVQQFDPPGVAASDLRECLLIQLRQFAPQTPYLEEAKLLVAHFLPLVAERDYPLLTRKTELTEEVLCAAIRLIQTLCPNPGELISDANVEYVVPDVRVEKREGRWLVSLNGDITPRLCINQQYAALVQRADSSADNTFLRNNLQEARWFLRSLESRNETLLRVSLRIVERQREFLEHGAEAMKPMVLADIANELDLHESTISRVTTKKYIDTPQGVFELKYFFSSHVSTASGGECSSTAIRAMLKRIIADETPGKPLSDNVLTTLLQDKGIQVARRTVAKYREGLGIGSSSERKRFAR